MMMKDDEREKRNWVLLLWKIFFWHTTL